MRAKLNERSRFSSKRTKASVVNTSGSEISPRVSMPAASSVWRSIRPKSSSPTLPRNAVFIPSAESAARKLQGAPPGCAAIVG